jgi:glucose-fructose oxidoreductase
VEAVKDLNLKAIYSRSLKSAKDLASNTTDIDLYSDDSGAGRSFADLLNRSDIGAVIIGYVDPSLTKPP